jgi:hypothetical protein
MGYNEQFARAVYLHSVPGDALGEYMERITGKPEEEKQRILDQIADEIRREYPLKPGRESQEES